jgi:hypothetical protein
MRDSALATAVSILDLFRHLLPPEQHQIAYQEIVVRVEAGIESAVIQENREKLRLDPCRN